LTCVPGQSWPPDSQVLLTSPSIPAAGKRGVPAPQPSIPAPAAYQPVRRALIARQTTSPVEKLAGYDLLSSESCQAGTRAQSEQTLMLTVACGQSGRDAASLDLDCFIAASAIRIRGDWMSVPRT
jgi:hypothetical protein